MWNEIKSKYPSAGIVVVIIVLLLCAFYVFGGNGSNREGSVDGIKNEVSNSLEQQRAVGDKLGEIRLGIDESRGTLGEIRQENIGVRTAIDEARTASRNSRELLDDSRQQLERCQSIIDNVSKGNPSGNSGTETKK